MLNSVYLQTECRIEVFVVKSFVQSIIRVLSTLVAREWKSTTMLTNKFLMASSSRIQ